MAFGVFTGKKKENMKEKESDVLSNFLCKKWENFKKIKMLRD